MRKGGFEPPQPFGHRILNPARLPVPPLSRYPQSQKSLTPVSIQATTPVWTPAGLPASSASTVTGCVESTGGRQAAEFRLAK